MSISFGWIDFSDADRKRMQQSLALLRPDGQLDELGIGSIRDKLADALFPGLSTIQTKPKYFFIVPYLLLNLRHSKQGFSDLKEQERKIKNHLKGENKGKEGSGIIGVTLPDHQASVRPPSEVYWAGIVRLGFIDAQGLSLRSFVQNISAGARHTASLAHSKTNDDPADGDDHFFQQASRDLIKVPRPERNWEKTLSMKLTSAEAQYLRKQLQELAGDSVLKAAASKVSGLDALLLESTDFSEFAKDAMAKNDPQLKTCVSHLRRALEFDEIMEGAHLLYNVLLQQKLADAGWEADAEKFMDEFNEWLADIQPRLGDFELAHWIRGFTANGPAIEFAHRWFSELNKPKTGLDKEVLKKIVKERETIAKGSKARLVDGLKNMEDVKAGERKGINRLSYRFQVAKRLFQDLNNPDAS